jgi:hypothetical protein
MTMRAPVYLDGEQIPDDRIREIFRWPPDLPRSFERSTLLIGSRGVGKSTFFRYLKVTHHGPAIHLALAADLASFGKDASLGPLGRGYSDAIRRSVANKAAGLLALSLSERFISKGLVVDREALLSCLPAGVIDAPKELSPKWCKDTRDSIGPRPLEDFAALPNTRSLAGLVSLVGEESARRGELLLILFDRADMVVPAALIPVAELLDQSAHFVALVAMRPGHGSEAFTADEFGAVPGDHFTVVHMGRTPYGQDWETFLLEAVGTQLGAPMLGALPEDLRRHVLILARDSLRTALELFLACRGAKPEELSETLASAIDAVGENYLVAAQTVLQQYHPDYRRLVSEIRKDVLKRHERIEVPVHLQISESRPTGLWERNTRVDGFIDAALRSRAACMPSGHVWVPGARVREVEIPPVVLWHPGDPYWTSPSHTPLTVRRTENSLFETGGGGRQQASIFVAYRMDFSVSRKFRNDLADLLGKHPCPMRITVEDGRVRHGEDWAPVIRSRIKAAKLVVGDITGLRNDVVFELGFGYGLRKPFIPVVENPEGRRTVPSWLRAKQIGSYETEAAVGGVASSVIAHITDPYISKPRRVRDPVPGLAVWLDFAPELAGSRDQFTACCDREGFTIEVLEADKPEDVLIDQAARATLLAAVLTGGKRDALVHFVAGAVVARPSAGYGTKSLARRVFLLGLGGQPPRDLAADSLLRCTDIVVALEPKAVLEELATCGREHRKWLKGSKSQPD